MKTIITLITLIFYSLTFGQTKVIAHKSHSGDMANFDPTFGVDNIGEIMIDPKLELQYIQKKPIMPASAFYADTLVKISDSSLIQISKIPIFADSIIRQIDTIVYSPSTFKPQTKQQDLEEYYPPKVTFIGFDSTNTKSEKIESPVQNVKQTDNEQSFTPVLPSKNDNNTNGSGFATSYLVLGLFLLMISLSFVILFRNRTFFQLN